MVWLLGAQVVPAWPVQVVADQRWTAVVDCSVGLAFCNGGAARRTRRRRMHLLSLFMQDLACAVLEIEEDAMPLGIGGPPLARRWDVEKKMPARRRRHNTSRSAKVCLAVHSQATASTLRSPARSPSASGRRAATTQTAPARSNISDSGRATQNFAADSIHAAEPPVAVGTTFARKYLLERLLGQGAMGAVYLARDLRLEREVAIKILLPAHATDAGIVDSFHREAVAMASVRHVNVVQIYTSGQYDGLLFFVMEYVHGRSVAALIREFFACGQLLPLDTVLGIIDQVSLGLAAMHRRGIFHGDVKPANMIIDESSHVAIADFGLVGSSRALTAAGEPGEANRRRHISGGTPLYIAPELIVGKEVPPEERHLCDVYSLGVSVFEMFTGHGPFLGRTIEKILKGHLIAPPPRLTKIRPDLPTALNPVIRRALAKQPWRRYPNCEELAFAVNWAVQDQS
jgi:serine/threonine protein kinase